MCHLCAQRTLKSITTEDVDCCEHKKGYYCDWGLVTTAMECEEWVELCDFRNVLRMLKYITFTVVQQRQTAKTALNNLKRIAPFGRCERFPDCSAYVNISCGIYSQQLKNVTMALDFKEREKEKQMRYHNDKNDPEISNPSSGWGIDDALTAYYNALETIQNELCSRNRVYDRVYFEAYHNLKWCDGPCPPCDKTPYKDPPKPNPPNGPERPRPPPPGVGYDTYEAVVKALVDIELNPSEFRFFERPGDNDPVRCGNPLKSFAEIQDRKSKLPNVTKFLVLTASEYAKCASAAEFIVYEYDQSTGTLTKSTRKVRTIIDIFDDDEWLDLVGHK